MKKLLLPLLLAVVMITASCGAGDDDAKETASPSAMPTPTASATAKTSNAPQATSAVDTGGTNIERMSPDDVADKEIADGRTENAFIGQWRAVGTTSENASFSALTLTITKDGYTVNMSFDNYDGSMEYAGVYELKNGVLTFDENFLDCSAYFYKGDIYTLVIDNGTSLVFCEHLEQEREMR